MLLGNQAAKSARNNISAILLRDFVIDDSSMTFALHDKSLLTGVVAHVKQL